MKSLFAIAQPWCLAGVIAALCCTAHAQETTSAPSADVPKAQSSSKPSAAAGKSNKAAKSSTESKKTAADRLELDKTVVTGNRELPKVLYIVPWKKSEIGDLPAQPFNTLLDEALTPVDRDVFKRELRYYDALQGASNGKPDASSGQGEK